MAHHCPLCPPSPPAQMTSVYATSCTFIALYISDKLVELAALGGQAWVAVLLTSCCAVAGGWFIHANPNWLVTMLMGPL